MAIIKRSDSEFEPAGSAQESIAVQEPPAAPAAPADSPPPAPPAQAPAAPPSEPAPPAAGVRSMTETLPSALEPELRRIIDTAVARVAAIELEAIREARELTQRSEQDARDALRFALDRAFNLINTLELLAATVGGMAEALKIELDDAIDALRSVPEPESELAKEMAQAAPAAVEPPPPAPEPEPVMEAQPAPEQEPQAEQPEAEKQDAEQLDAEKPEAVQLDAVKGEDEAPAVTEEQTTARAPDADTAPEAPAEEAPTTADRDGNGYPPAQRQAESLADAARETAEAEQHPALEPEPESQPERTVIRAPGSDDGKPAVPARRRGLVRRLFTK